MNPGDLAGRTGRDESAGLRLGIPIYADPDIHPEVLADVERAPAGSVVVINVDSGPGRYRDARYAARVERAQQRGHEVYGYVDTAYRQQSAVAVAAEVDRHHRWFGIGGITFDQVPGGADRLAHYRQLADLARGLNVARNMAKVDVEPRYEELANVLLVFDGAGAAACCGTVSGVDA